MKSILLSLRTLESAGYLRLTAQDNTLELLPHGMRYCEQLQRQWLNARTDVKHIDDVHHVAAAGSVEKHQSRLSFIHTKQFQQQLQQATCIPAIIRHCALVDTGANDLLGLHYNASMTHLITDFFVHAKRGLENLFSVQRESKIWWMRYSSNPSRYSMETLPLDNETAAYAKHCQSIAIKTCFTDGSAATVEELTLVPLQHALPQNKLEHASVIRSVIQLETATCALLLDACDHRRTHSPLLLNRKLAPYQCSITCLIESAAKSTLHHELGELYIHLKYVLKRAGLRLYEDVDQSKIYSHSQQDLNTLLQNNDSLGVPYTLLIDEVTLENGLCKLRSRDTTLAETIHISDIPNYLINIFAAGYTTT